MKFWHGAVGVMVLGCWVSGCGVAKPKTEALAGLTAAEGMRIVQSVEAGGRPSLTSAGYEDEVLVQDQRIAFQKAVSLKKPLPGGSALFLAWPEVFEGQRVVAAFFQQEIRDSHNFRVSLTDRQDVSFDPSTRQWFLPLDALLAGRLEDETPALLHLVDLDLGLEGGKRAEIRVEIRLTGPLPTPRVTALSHTANPLGDREWSVLEQEIVNPTQRSLVVWLEPAGRVDLIREAVRDQYLDSPRHAPVLQSTREYLAARYEVTRVTGAEPVAGAPTPLFRLELPPGESRRVSWVAQPAAGVAECPQTWAMRARIARWVEGSGGGHGEWAGEGDRQEVWVHEGLHPAGVRTQVGLAATLTIADPAAYRGVSAWEEFSGLGMRGGVQVPVRTVESGWVATAGNYQGGGAPSACQGWTRHP